MIVVSGALVLVAIVLLVLGLVNDSGLGFVYASIGVSIVAGVFLLVGALQRRGETAEAATSPGLAPTSDPLERVSAVNVTRPAPPADATPASPAGERPRVAVVPGRPRYHVESCRFLAGRADTDLVPIEDARADGYSACGVCRPDQAADAADAAEAAGDPSSDEATAAEAPETAAPARERAATATKSAAKPAAKRTAAAAKSAPEKAAKAPAAARAGTVVVIPDRDKFHTESCRFVRDVAGTLTVSKTTAKRQGYTPCGVCKP